MPSPGNLQALSPEMFVSIRLCLVLLLFAHLPFAGAILGGSALSLLLNRIGTNERDRRYLRFSRELIGAVTLDWKLLLPFLLLPVPFVGLVYELILSNAAVLPWAFWFLPTGGWIAAVFLLRAYGHAPEERTDIPGARFLTGLAGVLAGAFSFFLFWTVFGTVFNPEKLPLLGKRLAFLLSWNSIAKLHLLLAVFAGITGAVILRLVLRPGTKDEKPDPDYRVVVHTWGRTLVFLSSAGIPVFGALDLVSLPELALSPSVLAWHLSLPLFALAAVMLLPRSAENGNGGPAARIPILYALVVLVVAAGDQAAIGNVFRGRIAAPREVAAAPHGEEAEKEKPAAAAAGAEGKGKAVFERVCSGCHSFDARVVGPPLGAVVPKYAGSLEKLKGFIRSPAKVDPGYPQMPNLGLPEEEIDAVARYLLGEIRERKGKREEGEDAARSGRKQ